VGILLFSKTTSKCMSYLLLKHWRLYSSHQAISFLIGECKIIGAVKKLLKIKCLILVCIVIVTLSFYGIDIIHIMPNLLVNADVSSFLIERKRVIIYM